MDKNLESIIEVVKERNDKGSRCTYDGCNRKVKNEYYIVDGSTKEGPFGRDHALLFLVEYANGSGRKVRVPKEMQIEYEQAITEHEPEGSKTEVDEMPTKKKTTGKKRNEVAPYAAKPVAQTSIEVYDAVQVAEQRETALMAHDAQKFDHGVKFDYEQFAAQLDMLGQMNVADRAYALERHTAGIELQKELDEKSRAYQREAFDQNLAMQGRVNDSTLGIKERKALGDIVRQEYRPLDVETARSYARAA